MKPMQDFGQLSTESNRFLLRHKSENVLSQAKELQSAVKNFIREVKSHADKGYSLVPKIIIQSLERLSRRTSTFMIMNRILWDIYHSSPALSVFANESYSLSNAAVANFMEPFYTLMRPLSAIKFEYSNGGRNKLRLFPLANSYPSLMNEKLEAIGRGAHSIFRVGTASMITDLKNLQNLLILKARAAEDAGLLAPFTTSIKQYAIDCRLAQYKEFAESAEFHSLCGWGYHPSEWFRRLYPAKPKVYGKPTKKPRVIKRKVKTTKTRTRKSNRYKLQKSQKPTKHEIRNGKSKTALKLSVTNQSQIRGHSVKPDMALGQSSQLFKPSHPMRSPQPLVFPADVSSLTGNGIIGGCPSMATKSCNSSDGHGSSQNQRSESPDRGIGSNSGGQDPGSSSGQGPPSEHEDDEESDSELGEESDSELSEDSDMEEAFEEHTALSYQIPKDSLQAALEAPLNTRARYWTHQLYRNPEGNKPSIYYCEDIDIAEQVAKLFSAEKVLGFDIEWKENASRTSIKESVSLIQIACESRIALFHIARFRGTKPEELLPPTLKVILESPEILKVGVSIKGDVTRVEKRLPVSVNGVFELSRLHNLVATHATSPGKYSHRMVRLAVLVEEHLLLPLYKGEELADNPSTKESVRKSNWTKRLTIDQTYYAVDDAYAGFRLFYVLESKRKKLRPMPLRPPVYASDPPPRTQALRKPRSTRNPKPSTETLVTDTLDGLDVEVSEEEYETAAEELTDGTEGDDVRYFEPESETTHASEESEIHSDSDRSFRTREHFKTRGLPKTYTCRAGRVSDVEYPKLPTEIDVSYGSGAVGPIVETTLGMLTSDNVHQAALPAPDAERLQDEFSDPELEEALITMELDETLGQGNIQTADREQTSDDPTSLPSTENTTQPDIEMSDMDISPSSNLAPPTSSLPLHTPEYNLATTWAQTYLESTIPSPSSTAPPRIHATIPHLRAYHLWHHQHLSLDTITARLRDPPLAQSTVSNYILQAVSLEKLAYNEAELKALLNGLPEGLRTGRYAWLSKRVGAGR